jgi:tetratricopeptide (TPR) repeat protein
MAAEPPPLSSTESRNAVPLPQQPDLAGALAAYAGALEQLKQPRATDDDAVEACLARDLIARLLDGDKHGATTLEQLHTVRHYDDQLMQMLVDRFAMQSPKQFLALRQARNPNSTAWWWYDIEPDSTSLLTNGSTERLHAVYRLITLTALILALIIALVATLRLSRTPASLTDLGTYLQAITPLLVGTTLTGVGRQFSDAILRFRRVPQQHHDRARMWLALAVLCGPAIIFLTLPAQAIGQNNRGETAFRAGDMRVALDSFQRAVSMDPEYDTAYFNLGNAYTELNQPDAAIDAYRQALALTQPPPRTAPAVSERSPTRTWFYATNNLAQLLTLYGERSDVSVAVALLDRAISAFTPELRPAERAALLRNRAFAQLSLGLYQNAKADLDEARLAAPDAPATGCVAGLFYEAEGNPFRDLAAASAAWVACLGATPDDGVPAIWTVTAQERFRREP